MGKSHQPWKMQRLLIWSLDAEIEFCTGRSLTFSKKCFRALPGYWGFCLTPHTYGFAGHWELCLCLLECMSGISVSVT